MPALSQMHKFRNAASKVGHDKINGQGWSVSFRPDAVDFGFAVLMMTSLAIASLSLSILLGVLVLLFIFRIILTWYPQVDLSKFPFSLVAIPTEPFLAPTRKLIPPLGGVDISPVLWVGILSLARELLLGQQGILTMMNHV